MKDTSLVTEEPWIALVGDTVPPQTGSPRDPRLAALIGAAEVTVANLEIPLTTRGVRAEKVIVHRADPQAADVLQDYGVDLVTLGNNHAMDFGAVGLKDTFDTLSAAGIAYVGAGEDLHSALSPAIRESASGTTAVFGVCCTLPPGFAAGDGIPGVAPIRVVTEVTSDLPLLDEQPGMAPFVRSRAVDTDLNRLLDDIRKVRSRVDLLIVAIHWGVPEGLSPSSYGALAEYQRPLGHALVDAGADVVVGHHPHVVQPLEMYRGKVIAYSIGNFMFANWGSIARGTPAGEELLRSRIPIAPYRNVLGSSATLESVVVLVMRGSRSTPVVRFIPTVMVEGEPVIADRERSRTILDRLLGRWPAAPGVPGAPELVDAGDLWLAEATLEVRHA